ncbi:MAG: carboxymuconolactone decarboxylase family protein [Opitutae bacterium]|nr:carboxymuconolactone decarboxylase family protein [Opitutae bacterium]
MRPAGGTTLTERLAVSVELEALRRELGFVPNFFSVLSHSPLAFLAVREMQALMDRHAVLSPAERHLVMLAISSEHACEYCARYHYLMSASVGGATEAICAVRDRLVPTEPRICALVEFSREIVRTGGKVDEHRRAEFVAAGGSLADALDILTLVAFTTLTNYTNHIARTPVDPAFRAMR